MVVVKGRDSLVFPLFLGGKNIPPILYKVDIRTKNLLFCRGLGLLALIATGRHQQKSFQPLWAPEEQEETIGGAPVYRKSHTCTAIFTNFQKTICHGRKLFRVCTVESHP